MPKFTAQGLLYQLSQCPPGARVVLRSQDRHDVAFSDIEFSYRKVHKGELIDGATPRDPEEYIVVLG